MKHSIMYIFNKFYRRKENVTYITRDFNLIFITINQHSDSGHKEWKGRYNKKRRLYD